VGLIDRFLYYPTRYPDGYWDLNRQLDAADVWLDSADGVRLHCWYIARPEKFVTLFLHGNAGNLSHRYLHFREITEAGSSILMLDYRGYGRSAGKPSEKGLHMDADSAYQYLLDIGHQPQDIIVHGESLGSAVAVDLASRRRCGALILEAPFTAACEVAGSILPIIGPLLVKSFDSRQKIRRVQAPILFIHGAADDVIPLRFGKSLFDLAREPKNLWIVPRAGHNDIVEMTGSQYRERLRSFNESVGQG
jgi:fermentation-respiration switch protein FrsA (DUF1100 family)